MSDAITREDLDNDMFQFWNRIQANAPKPSTEPRQKAQMTQTVIELVKREDTPQSDPTDEVQEVSRLTMEPATTGATGA